MIFTFLRLHAISARSASRIAVLCAPIAVSVIIGCLSSYDTTDARDLSRLNGKGPLRALTVDTTLYTLDTFTFDDSTISGSGFSKHGAITAPFSGTLSMGRILFIERLEVSTWKTVLFVPMALAVIAGVAWTMSEAQGRLYIRPNSGSCPYVYAFDGNAFRMEGEAFGTSLSRAFEAQTLCALPDLVPANGALTIRLSNERPETHLINSVRLFAADARDATAVALDIHDVLWPVSKAISPSAAHDDAARNILSEIARTDQRYWKSSLAHTSAFSGFRDTIDLMFDAPRGLGEATLVIHAINTNVIDEVFRAMGAVLGDATMQFYAALEHDTLLQQSVRSWKQESSLRVEVEHGGEYRFVGVMPPEANVAPFTRAIRITGLDTTHGPLHVRLSSLTDVWRIDAVEMDFTPAKPIPVQPLKMLSVTSSDSKNWNEAVAAMDSQYALVLPPNHIDIAFDPAPAMRMRHPVYVSAVQGYLYEWLPSAKSPASPVSAAGIDGSDRIAMLQLLMHQKDVFLPSIYSAWRHNTGESVVRSP